MRKLFTVLTTAFIAVGVFAQNALAAIDIPESIAVTDAETMAGVVLTALATIWVVRKLIKMVNKS
jgi:hypothetical protein